MPFNWLLFDLDNTLIDFSNTSKLALTETLLTKDIILDDELYQIYHRVNELVWKQFENKEIDALTLRSLRFNNFFKEIDISTIDAAEFNAAYLQTLVRLSTVYPGVTNLLSKLKQSHTLSAVTNGLQEVQRPRLKLLKLTNYFDSITVSDEIGVAKPDPLFFDHVFNSISRNPKKDEILIIGDSLTSDIKGGINYGIKTCWISHGRKNESGVVPDFVIDNVLELTNALMI